MPGKQGQSCENCTHTQWLMSNGGPQYGDIYECRRRAPIYGPKRTEWPHCESLWPVTSTSGWCGEWEAE